MKLTLARAAVDAVPVAAYVAIDFETRSTVELSDVGAYVYAAHPDTEALWLCWAPGDAPVARWRPGNPDPAALLAHVEAGGVVPVHNAEFELAIWNMCLRRRYVPHWPELRTSQVDCTMSRSLHRSLPAGLSGCAAALRLPAGKDEEGSRLMRRMAKPDTRERRLTGRIVWHETPAEMQRLGDYCARDVEVLRTLHTTLAPLTPTERRVWELDRRINDRGVAIDRAAATVAAAVVELELTSVNARVAELTDGAVPTINSHARLRDWLDSPDTTAETVELWLERDDLDATRREVLELRRDAGKASVAKLPSILAHLGSDDRMCGTLAYGGAGRTLRWAGRGPQPQNLLRPSLKPPVVASILDALPTLPSADDAREWLDAAHGPPIDVLSNCLRGLFTAAPGRELTVVDLANIEGRVAAWLANEGWKLTAYREFDGGRGPDLYKVAYARTFGGRPEDVSDDGDDRQIGKIMELFLQYAGGRGAFATGAAAYGFDILSPGLRPRPGRRAIPESVVEPAKQGWRTAHPQIVRTWHDVEHAAMRATMRPGTRHPTCGGRVTWHANRLFLFADLPSGRRLCYYRPRVVDGRMGPCLEYDGVNSRTRQWGPLTTYGGKLFENVVQAVARDVFACGMLRLDERGAEIVLHVHDAVVVEHGPGQWTSAGVAEILCDVGLVYVDLPVAAKGYTSRRLQK